MGNLAFLRPNGLALKMLKNTSIDFTPTTGDALEIMMTSTVIAATDNLDTDLDEVVESGGYERKDLVVSTCEVANTNGAKAVATSNVTWTGSGDGFTYRGIAIVRAFDGLIWRYYNYSQDQTVTAGQPVPLFLEGQTIAEISAQD